jgi:hypothetical protein
MPSARQSPAKGKAETTRKCRLRGEVFDSYLAVKKVFKISRYLARPDSYPLSLKNCRDDLHNETG